MTGLLRKFEYGKYDDQKLCLVRTAMYCGECLYNGTRTGMRGICRKCGKFRDKNWNGGAK